MNPVEHSLEQFRRAILKEPASSSLFTSATASHVWVYQSNYFYGLLNALLRCYSVTGIALGEENLKYFGKLYVESTPSKSPNLDDYGSEFSEFLNTRAELEALPYLPTLAAIDWLWFNAWESPAAIQVFKGTLMLWEALRMDLDCDGIEIDPDEVEWVSVYYEQGRPTGLRSTSGSEE